MSLDITIVEAPGEPLMAHHPDCIVVTVARGVGWPLLTMYDCQAGIPADLEVHHCLRKEERMDTTNAVLCPRCERNMYTPYGATRAPQGAGINEIALPPALSRMDNATYICSPCGTEEAMRDMMGAPPIPPSEWPVKPDAPEFGLGSHTGRPVPE